jgi:hypothetical protein
MSAFGELYLTKTVAAGPTMEQANASLATAMAKLDKVLDNPNSSAKAIAAASTAVNKATATLATATINRIDNPVTNTITNTNTNTDGGVIVRGSIGSSSITATPPAPEPEIRMFAAPPPVKTATLDIILFDEESVPTDKMFDQIFENIGGQELISITRSDIVNGQKISYQPIKNLSAIQQRYNPNNILSLQQTADKFFAGFSIKLEDKIPETGNGTNGENVYLNAAGDLIIEFINVNPDEQVETQISVSGTIYEADLGDYTS